MSIGRNYEADSTTMASIAAQPFFSSLKFKVYYDL